MASFFSYVTLAMLVNRTRIALDNGILSIRHGPVPYRGSKSIAIDTIERFASEEIIGRKNSRWYNVIGTLRTGRRIELLDGLPNAAQARFIAELLSQRSSP